VVVVAPQRVRCVFGLPIAHHPSLELGHMCVYCDKYSVNWALTQHLTLGVVVCTTVLLLRLALPLPATAASSLKLSTVR
jgi:hypothetical protein